MDYFDDASSYFISEIENIFVTMTIMKKIIIGHDSHRFGHDVMISSYIIMKRPCV